MGYAECVSSKKSVNMLLNLTFVNSKFFSTFTEYLLLKTSGYSTLTEYLLLKTSGNSTFTEYLLSIDAPIYKRV